MGTLNRLHVEIECACLRVRSDGSVSGVCKGAGLAIAEPSDVVFIAAKILLFRSPTISLEIARKVVYGLSRPYFSLKEQNC